MNKNNIIVLSISIVLLSISILGLILYFCVFKTEENKKELFYVTCENINGEIGQWVNIPFIVSENDADIVFEIQDEEIAKISGNKIQGLNIGQTLIKIIATKDDKRAVCSFYFTSKYSSCYIDIIAVENCEFNNNTLSVKEGSCQFYYNFYDENGKLIENPAVQIVASENLLIEETPFGFSLFAGENGTLKFDFLDYNYIIEIKVNIILDIQSY